ncbi:MAG: peptidoglycan bridge formation glycyltransferase FemA/FemB family protein [Patescibacteria group bacterium]
MKLIEVTKKDIWESIQLRIPWSQFTQSWAWGDFRASLGYEVRRFALLNDENQCLTAVQMEFRPKKYVGGFWFAPRGPVFLPGVPKEQLPEVMRELIEKLDQEDLSKSLFWRFEPLVELGKPEGFIPLCFRRNNPTNPASTLLLDISKGKDEILRDMHQKTRYNVRVAARDGVTSRIATHPDEVKIFLNMMQETADRQRFVQHDSEYIEKAFRFLVMHGMARIRLAEYGDKILAANFEIQYGNTLTYLHGASSSDERKLMAPYALHWDAIAQAIRDGIIWYDMWGINPESKASFTYKESWEGITRFKHGWGGKRVDLYGTWDLPFNYPLYRLAFWKLWRS